MPRFLRLGDTVIHVPSVSNVSMNSNCFGKPYLTISYHTESRNIHHYYGVWSDCEADFNRVKDAVKEVETLLSSIPLTEQESTKPATVSKEKTQEALKEMTQSAKEVNIILSGSTLSNTTLTPSAELEKLNKENEELSGRMKEAMEQLNALSQDIAKGTFVPIVSPSSPASAPPS